MKSVWNVLKKLHQDERGAEGLEKLLIIAAIVLPLLGCLIVFRQKVGEWATNMWNTITGNANTPVPAPQ